MVVVDARQRGGVILSGGERVGGQGYFYQPTVVTGLQDDALLFSEEAFGPLLPVTAFRSTEEVIARANAVEAGLAGYVFTRSIATAHAAMHGIEVGMLGVNTLAISTPETPFGGIKQSGHGSEGGLEGLQAFQQTRLITQV